MMRRFCARCALFVPAFEFPNLVIILALCPLCPLCLYIYTAYIKRRRRRKEEEKYIARREFPFFMGTPGM